MNTTLTHVGEIKCIYLFIYSFYKNLNVNKYTGFIQQPPFTIVFSKSFSLQYMYSLAS